MSVDRSSADRHAEVSSSDLGAGNACWSTDRKPLPHTYGSDAKENIYVNNNLRIILFLVSIAHKIR